jgi:branched-chain amino acid transport system substrate-binding protein
VILPVLFKRRAVSIVYVGMAFLFLSCQQRMPAPKPLEPEPGSALFYAAELDYGEGRKDQALEAYDEFVTRHPESPRVRDALYRMARIHEEAAEYEQALTLYRRILTGFPSHPGYAEVSLAGAGVLHRLGRHEESRDELLRWLSRFRDNPLAGQALLILGKAFGELGDETNAFTSFVRASRVVHVEDPMQQELDGYVTDLLKKAETASLQSMAEAAPAGTRYLPAIYERIAELALDANDLDLAIEAAMALVRSTPDQTWVNRGRELLERVSEETAVKVGVFACLLPLSGPFAIYGQEVLNGIQLGMGVFDASEQDRAIELLIEDTESDPEVAAKKVEELVHNSRVMGIIGPLASRTAAAAARKAQELGVPIITLAQREGITAEGDMVFRNFLTPAREMERLVSKATRDLGLSRFGILYPESAYGRRLLNLFRDQVNEAGAYVTAVESYAPDLTDFSEEIRKMVGLHHPRPPWLVERLKKAKIEAFNAGVESGPYPVPGEPEPIVEFDAVFIPDSFQKIVLIAPQFPFHDIFNIRFLGTSLWQAPELLEQGAEYLQGAVFPTGFFARPEDAFVELYKEKFETDPSILAAIGYDTARFLEYVMETYAPRTRRAFHQALLSPHEYHGIRGSLSFDDQREATTPAILLTIRGKSFIPIP